ncbi:MAG: HAD family hydrolase [Candidatus Promineofilum sp.]|nr:HAD family hydrolase [Promineifilum sp.]
MKLILFDIDGTLVNSSRIGRAALGQALLHVFGTTGALETFEFAGKTDRRIVRDLMTVEGWSDSAIDGRLLDLDERMAAAGRDLFTPATVWACPGIPTLLEELGRREDVVPALLTGNIRHTAALKLAAAGIDPDQFIGGAFGSDSLERDDLFDIALESVRRATGQRFARSQAVIVGDTPADIRCARSGGGRVIAVATGPYPAEVLGRHQPDYLFPDLAQTNDVLRAILEPIGTPLPAGG